jgi:hypothetical protein
MSLNYNRNKNNAHTLLESLPKYFTNATTLYIEGVNIAEDIVNRLEKHADGKEYDLISQTVFPVSKRFRCKFSCKLMKELARLSDNHAEPEMMDHMFIYAGSVPLLIWCDAFYGNIEICTSVSEETIIEFATENGLNIVKE